VWGVMLSQFLKTDVSEKGAGGQTAGTQKGMVQRNIQREKQRGGIRIRRAGKAGAPVAQEAVNTTPDGRYWSSGKVQIDGAGLSPPPGGEGPIPVLSGSHGDRDGAFWEGWGWDTLPNLRDPGRLPPHNFGRTRTLLTASGVTTSVGQVSLPTSRRNEHKPQMKNRSPDPFPYPGGAGSKKNCKR